MENKNDFSRDQLKKPPNEIFPPDKSEIKTVRSFHSTLAQVLAGSAKALLMFQAGLVLAFKTIIIANILNNTKSQPSFTDDEASWFASLQFICQPVGCMLSAVIVEPMGRKRSMMILNTPFLIGWLLIAFAQSVPQLYIGSIVLGLAIGFIEAPAITYLGEIAEPKIRSILMSAAEAVFGAATLIVFLLGVYLDWRTIASLCSVIPVFSFIAISQVPESPIWLLAQNRTEDAEKALCWLRGWVKPEFIQEEFSNLILYKNNKISNKVSTTGHSNNISNNNSIPISGTEKVNLKCSPFPTILEQSTNCNNLKLHTEKVNGESNINIESQSVLTPEEEKCSVLNIIYGLFQPTMLRALLLMLGFFLFNAANGYNAVRSFSVPVFIELGISVEPYRANVITGIAVTIGTFALIGLVRIIGKRKIVLFSCIGSAATCVALGFYAHQISKEKKVQSLLPFIVYTAHVFFVGFGLFPVPWLYLSEIFPYRGRGLATGITVSAGYIFSFLITKTFYTITDAISLAGTFFLYGFASIVGFVFLYLLLPETEGKTLQDIEDDFAQLTIKQKKPNLI